METNYWYETMPGVYQAEIETLKNGLPFFKVLRESPKEQLGQQLGFEGELSYGEDKRQLILIIFPHGYPFCAPHIYPLEEVRINNFAGYTPKPFGRGNQYNDHRMCLFREEEVWQPFVDGIGKALQQAAGWLETATSQEGFTADKIVEENNPDLPYIGQVLFHLESTPEFKEGVLMLKMFKANYYSLIQIQLTQENQIQVLNSIPDKTPITPIDSTIIISKCFRLKENPKQVLPKLINTEYFKLLLLNKFNTSVVELLPPKGISNQNTIVAFALGEERDLHFFQLTRVDEGIEIKFQLHYLLPKNLSTELFIRIANLFNPEILYSKSVLIVGLGSIGAEVAVNLATSGLGSFTLIDAETFEAGNSVRHASDLLKVGESKVEVARNLIQAKNPRAKVTSIQNSIFNIERGQLIETVKKTDIILDFTANSLVSDYLSDVAFNISQKPIVQAAVSIGGFSGIVSVFIPNVTACPECQKKFGTTKLPFPAVETQTIKETKPDYGPCSQPALPASGIDTKEVALQAARATLQFLINTEDTIYPKLKGNQLYWHGPAGSKDASGQILNNAFNWEVVSVPPNKSCEICTPNK